MRLSPLAGAIGALALSAAAHAAGPECSPLTYGAVGDGVTDNTAAIQSAIDACEATYGGGVVRLSAEPGKTTYLTGPIRLANHIRLQLDKSVTLLGTTDHSRYHIAFRNHPFHANEALVSADQAIDTGIIGPGTIDGQGGMPAADGGPSWWDLTQAPGAAADGTTSTGVPRPWLVEFDQCTGVTVNDVTFRNAPMWNLVLRYSKYITVSELSVTVTPDHRVANTDGIDLVGSTDATLIFLNISSGGDSVALKSGLPLSGPVAGDPQAGAPLPTHDIQIVNSRFSNGNGIVVGGEAADGVYNVVANNIIATGTTHALQIKADRTASSHGAGDYNIWLENAALTDVGQPLMIGGYDRSADAAAEPPYEPPPSATAVTANIHDVTVLNLTATGATQPSLIVGFPEACVRNVTLNNVHVVGSSAVLQLRNMTGTFTNVTAALPDGTPPFVAQQNVRVTVAGATPPIASAPPEVPTSSPGQPCG